MPIGLEYPGLANQEARRRIPTTQDLKGINKVTVSLHPVILNPYTLLSQILGSARWFTCLDLKDAFFCLRLVPQSQPLFAFEWTEPITGHQMHLTWTRLPQVFKNLPTLFGEALVADLANFPRETTECVLLQYIDDFLLASDTQEDCMKGTKALLQLLSYSGYQASWKKGTGLSAAGLILRLPPHKRKKRTRTGKEKSYHHTATAPNKMRLS